MQDFTHTDVKLLLGFLACGVALGSTGWVYWQKIEWEDSKGIMKIAVGLLVPSAPIIPTAPLDFGWVC